MTSVTTARTRRLFLFFILSVMVLGVALTAHAAEEAPNPAEQPIGTAFKWINFVIVAGGIVYVARRYGPSFFRGRADAISSAIAQATATKNEADRQLRDAETRFANLQQEVAELRAAAGREAASESGRIRTATQKEAEKISQAAQAEIEAAERAARLELKALAAKLAVDGAESLLAKQLTPQAQESLVRAFVQSLEERPN